MKNKLGVILLLSLFSCESNIEQKQDVEELQLNGVEEVHKLNDKEEQGVVTFEDEVDFVKYCFLQLNEGNIEAVRPFVSEDILLSPYAYIEQKTVRKVSLAEIEAPKIEPSFWGYTDGKGDSILMTTPEYLDKYVFSIDINDELVKTSVYEGRPKAYGSELHNVHEVYPKAKMIEFYKPASKEGHFDWKTLIFVIEEVDGKFLLKAIIHNQWTV